MSEPPEDPFRPILREIAIVVAFLLVVLYLTACTATPEAPTTAKPAFPGDMRVVCYQGTYWIGSIAADEVVQLPIRCTGA